MWNGRGSGRGREWGGNEEDMKVRDIGMHEK